MFLCPYRLLTLKFSPSCVYILSINAEIFQLLEKNHLAALPTCLFHAVLVGSWLYYGSYLGVSFVLFPSFILGSQFPAPQFSPCSLNLGWVHPSVASTKKICGREILKTFMSGNTFIPSLLSTVIVLLGM